jgi:hypothetical protein
LQFWLSDTSDWYIHNKPEAKNIPKSFDNLSAPLLSRMTERDLVNSLMAAFQRLPSFLRILQPGESDRFSFSKSFYHLAYEVRLPLVLVVSMEAMMFSFNGYLRILLGEYMLELCSGDVDVSDHKGWRSRRRFTCKVHPVVSEFIVPRFFLPVVVVTKTLPLCLADVTALVSATFAVRHAAKQDHLPQNTTDTFCPTARPHFTLLFPF